MKPSTKNEETMLSIASEVGRPSSKGERMNRQDRHAKPPPIEIPVEILAEIKPTAPKRVTPKPRHAKALAPVPPKQGLLT